MRILLLDNAGLMTDFAVRCMDAGHTVKWFVRPSRMTLNIGKGMLTGQSAQVSDWREWAKWADLIMLPDNVRYLQDLEPYRKMGIPIVAASSETAAWETDRQVGQNLMKKRKLPVPDFKQFSDYDSAIAYVKREGRAFVCKPCGDEEDKSLSYVGKSPADLVFMLERWKKQSRHKDAFILQERVKGVEMAVGGWFGPGGFIAGWHENFEEKKLFPGALGPNTGEMGTSIRVVKNSKLANKVLVPFEEDLHRADYVGYVDVNCIIDEDGTPWPLEFTMRPGWPTFNIQMALLCGDPAEWLVDLAEGRDAKPFRLNESAVGVVVAMPDFPYSQNTRKDCMGIPLYGNGSKSSNFHPCELQQGAAPHEVNGKIVSLPCLVTAGDYLFVASGVSESTAAAARKAYRVVDAVGIPNSPFHRIDIARHVPKTLGLLQPMGYALGWSP